MGTNWHYGLATWSGNMKPAELLQVRTRSSSFVDAHARRLLVGKLYEHGQLSVVYDHVVELNCEEGEEGRPGART